MPASFNRALLLGNLTRDPELRYIPSGQAVATFTVACNRTYLAQSGERKEEVSFIRIVTWGKQAENCNEYLKKGSSVFVEGRLQSRSWEAADGTKRSTIEVVAQTIQFLGRPAGKAPASDEERSVPAPEESIIEDGFGSPAESKVDASKLSEEAPPF